jgi:ribonuclease HI
MTATHIAQLLGPALRAQGFHAVVDAAPMPQGYGHKIALRLPNGHAIGSVVVYAGQKGPRLVTSELRQPSEDVLARISKAWRGIAILPFDEAVSQIEGIPTPAANPVTNDTQIELWVDGACLARPDGFSFGWACLIQAQGQEVYRHASSAIAPYMAEHRNVAAELQAVMHGLETCRLRQYQAVTVFYDYTGIEQWATRRWKTNTRTTQEYATYVQTCPLRITWHKVPAHCGVPLNELVDSLATNAARTSSDRYQLTTKDLRS